MIRKYLEKRLAAFAYSFSGIVELLRFHPHIHIHAVATVVVIGLGFYLGINRTEWIAIVFACGIVWTAEAFNTSIEYLTDLVSPDFHPLAGKVKDIASAAVLISCVTATIVGGLVFLPYWWQ